MIASDFQHALSGKTLVICRTPFQAVLVRKVIQAEYVDSYDLIYFTQDNSEEDVHYFKELSACADLAQYLFFKRHNFDILNHLRAYLQLKGAIKQTKYSRILISSIDNLALRKLAVKNLAAKIISFDDGVGHISKFSDYLTEKNWYRSVVYNFAFGVPTIPKFIEKITQHYSIYRGFKNIMPEKILRHIDIFPQIPIHPGSLNSVKFFIGQPFEYYCDARYILNLKKYIENIKCDYYVKHPQESFPLVNTIPLLNKNACIAEEAIFKICGKTRPTIIGGFSSVLMNISQDVADKVMVLRYAVEEDAYYAELGTKAGCKITYL